MSSTGHYHRRWSSGTAGRTTPTSSSLTSNVEPSTYGTSWNSVRWNKPASSAYRSHSSSIAARFDTKPSYSASPARNSSSVTSRYTTPSIAAGLSTAARTAASVASLGPSVTARASRFDTSVRDQKDKYRTEARDLINKWTSRERTGGAENSYTTRKAAEPTSTVSSYLNKSSNDYPYRTSSMTPSRGSLPASNRYSSIERSSLMSPSPTPQPATLKMERPWRQRMAESSRIRATHGDEVSASYAAARSRRGSLSQASGDELSSCLGRLRSYVGYAGGYGSRQSSRESSVYGPTARFTSSYQPSSSYRPEEKTTMKYMSRSYSPVRSPVDLFKNSSASRIQAALVERALSRNSSQESISLRDDSRDRHAVSAVPKNPSIREDSRERDTKKRTSKDRTARRNSRQRSRSQQMDSSSSEEDCTMSKEEAKRRRRRKRNGQSSPSLPPTPGIMTKSMQSSMYETGKEDVNGSQDTALGGNNTPVPANLNLQLTESEGFQSCAASPCSPKPGQKISRNNSKTRLPSKSQLIKCPSIVEVPGISKSDSKSNISAMDKTTMSNSLDNLDELLFDSESSAKDDESQYSAVAHFKPFKPKVKPLAPVPGVWNQAIGEENISRNKAFHRDESHAATFIVWKVRPREMATRKVKMAKEKEKKTNDVIGKENKTDQKVDQSSPVKKLFLNNKKSKLLAEEATSKDKEVKKIEDVKEIKEVKEVAKVKPVEKPVVIKPQEEKAVQIAVALKAKEPSAAKLHTWIEKRRLTATHPKKIKPIPKEASTLIAKGFERKPSSLKTIKTLRPKGKISSSSQLSCKASSDSEVVFAETLNGKDIHGGAQVIVDTPQKGLNMSRARLRVRERRSMPSLSELQKQEDQRAQEAELERIKAAEEMVRSASRESQSKAAEVLDEMRDTEPALEWKRDDHDILILPDQSILEEYVKRKRGRLERLHSEPLRERDELSGCDSPCLSTTSELLPASSVRVHEPLPRLPIITAPSRSSSSVETSTPTAMLDSYHSSYNNFNSTPQAFLRTNTARQQCAKPIQFDAPKTPFEERLQMQATAIRKASTASNISEEMRRSSSPRRTSVPSDGMASISSAFTAALAERQGNNRHERYAAHIPVNRGEGSGRQSAASVESSQSGVLDTATKQLDQVIDQARHRHHQHRSKFKEAIDYLDQIFEDLKKECDVPAEDRNNNCDEDAPRVSSAKNKDSQEIRRPTIISQPAPSKTSSLPNRSQRHHKPVQPPSPVELLVAAALPQTPPDVAVTETFVLPKKTDKLDFTRRWLQDDLSSLARQPAGPVSMMPESQYTDADEHSLGSCSAEVAAINASDRKEKKKTTVPSKPMLAGSGAAAQLAPIRPQPCRPQPLYGMPGSSNGTRQFPVELEAPCLQRVASYDQMADRQQRDSGIWRSGSQEPYQTLASVRSDADSRPSPSAFHNVSAFQTRGGMRGSLRSLPDASVVRGRGRPISPPRDPAATIDMLVAELELNTEQPMSTADKRRSFPTSLRTEDPPMRMIADRRAPARGRGTNGYPSQASYHAPVSHVASNPIQTATQRAAPPRQQKSLDEVAMMLNSVVNDFGAHQMRKKQQAQQTPHAQYGLAHGPPQSNPFETINQEKINPSRVEAMHNMFERGSAPTSQQAWRTQQPQPYKPHKDEDCYYDIAEFAVKPYKRVSPPRQQYSSSSSSVRRHSPHDGVPAYPLTQPPQHPPQGSANSSTNGGYYSSNSSTAGPTHNQPVVRRSSLVGRQSVSSRAPSMDEEDDGFYDNIGVYDDRRFSRGSELDNASISSRHLPPKQNKIGSFLRKIGGSRPPQSAASLVSLNKVSNETPMKSGMLMKSNSLSNEPWKQQILQQSMPREVTSSKGGLGARLKNSLFGSKKRLNG